MTQIDILKNSLGKVVTLIFLMMISNFQVGATVPDSLIQELTRHTSFKKRMRTYLDQAKYYHNIDQVLSTEILKLGLNEEELEKYPHWKLKLLVELSHNRIMLTQGVNASNTVSESIDLALVLDNPLELFQTYARLGLAYAKTLNSEKAKIYLKKAQAIAKKHTLENVTGEIENLKGIVCGIEGKFQESAIHFRRILGRTDEGLQFQLTVLSNLGMLNMIQNELDSALHYQTRALQFTQEYGWKEREAMVLNRLAVVHDRLGDSEMALSCARNSLRICERLNFNFGLAQTHSTLSGIYSGQGDQKNADFHALEYYKFNEIWTYELDGFNMNDIEGSLKKNIESLKKESSSHTKTKNKLSSNRNLYLAFLSGTILIILILITLFLFRRRKHLRMKEKNTALLVRIEKSQEELSLKKAQISKVYTETKEIAKMIHLLVNDNPKSSFMKEIETNIRTVHEILMRESDWTRFKEDFSKTYPNFEATLIANFSDLSQNDIQICIYSRAGLTQKEISDFKDISLEGVKSSVKRVKKKMNVPSDMKLFEYLGNL